MGDRLLERGSRLPAYLRIYRELCDRVLSGRYQPGEFLPPERDLATEFQVSRPTIRLAVEALRREHMVEPEQGRGTRVLQAVGPSSGFNLTALVIYGISRDGSAAILQGCQSVMRHADHHLVVCETAHDSLRRAEEEAWHLRSLLDKGIGGIIIYAEPTERNRDLLQEALDRGVQVVQIDRWLPGLDCDFVGVDNRQASKELAENLIGEGHRKIGFMAIDPMPSTARERLAGYQDAMEKVGLFDQSLIRRLPQRDDLEHELSGFLPDLASRTTAIMALNDHLAITAIQVARSIGIDVPRELSIAGFDDQSAARILSPSLTTVQQPFRALGEAAGRMLIDRMSGRYRGKPRKLLLPTRLMLRESTAPSLNSALVAV